MSSKSLILRSGLPREPPVSVARQGRDRRKEEVEAEVGEEEEVEAEDGERSSLRGKEKKREFGFNSMRKCESNRRGLGWFCVLIFVVRGRAWSMDASGVPRDQKKVLAMGRKA